MSYTPHDWITGEIITEAELDNIESGVVSAHSRIDAADSAAATLSAQVAALPTQSYVDAADSALGTRVSNLETRSFATVAFSGNYNDLSGRPGLSTVALTGSYNDLLSRPTLYTDTQTFNVISTALVGGSNVTLTVDSVAKTVTIDAATSSVTISGLPANALISQVQNGDGSWPNRPTSRTDLKCVWIRIVTGSSNPASATSPAVNGAYSNDVVVGA